MKLQPNFSWQKYEGAPEDQKEQFQYQLQQQHIQVANSVNATIDDESYFTRERITAFRWLNNRPVWTKTITGTVVGTAVTPYPHGIVGLGKVIELTGCIQDAEPVSIFALPLPYVDPITLANGVGIFADTTDIFIATNSVSWNGYLFSITIYYTKV